MQKRKAIAVSKLFVAIERNPKALMGPQAKYTSFTESHFSANAHCGKVKAAWREPFGTRSLSWRSGGQRVEFWGDVASADTPLPPSLGCMDGSGVECTARSYRGYLFVRLAIRLPSSGCSWQANSKLALYLETLLLVGKKPRLASSWSSV